MIETSEGERGARAGIVLCRPSPIRGVIALPGIVAAGALLEEGADASRQGYDGPSLPSTDLNDLPGYYIEITDSRHTHYSYTIIRAGRLPSYSAMFQNDVIEEPIALEIEGGLRIRTIDAFDSITEYFTPAVRVARFRARSMDLSMVGPSGTLTLS